MERDEDSMRLLQDSRSEALAVKGFATEVTRNENGSSVSGAVLYNMHVLPVLRRADDALGAGRHSQVTGCFKRRRASYTCSVPVRYRA